MKDAWTDRWNERYSNAAYAYGELPNDYLNEQLKKLAAGKILFPADGEGRNGVFAAKLGWDVSAFDISVEGRRKALQLADKNCVRINYRLGELEPSQYAQGEFDVIALIYAHFPAIVKSAYHKMLDKFLRKEGLIIFEAFSKKHIDYIARNEKVGGPRDIESLFSIDEILFDFANYNFIELTETEIELNEGTYHNGVGSVIRFVAQKQ